MTIIFEAVLFADLFLFLELGTLIQLLSFDVVLLFFKLLLKIFFGGLSLIDLSVSFQLGDQPHHFCYNKSTLVLSNASFFNSV